LVHFSDRGQVVFLWADRVVTSRSLDGTYPPYRQLIPASFSRRICCNATLPPPRPC